MMFVRTTLISLALLAGAVAPAAAQTYFYDDEDEGYRTYYQYYDYNSATIKDLDSDGRGGHESAPVE